MCNLHKAHPGPELKTAIRRHVIEQRRLGGLATVNNLLQHKGVYGSIEVSAEDHCLFGKLQFISALVSYEGQTLAELEVAFKDAADDHLSTCKHSAVPAQLR